MPRDFEDGELDEALAQTNFLHRLGGQSFNPRATAPPIVTPANPWAAFGSLPPVPIDEPQPKMMTKDVLMLDDSCQATLGGRTFTLTEAEMKKVMASVERGYARAMRRELARVRESVFGNKAMQPVPETGRTPYAQDVRGMQGPRRIEITYPDTPPDREVPVVRKSKPRKKQVSNMLGPKKRKRVAPLNTLTDIPLSTVTSSDFSGESVRADRLEPTPATKGGGESSGRSS